MPTPRASRARAPSRRGPDSWVDAARFQRARDFVDPGDERRLPQGDALFVRKLPHAVERVAELVGEARANLVARPEEPAEILDPFEVGDGHAAGVREHVREDEDAPLGEDR